MYVHARQWQCNAEVWLERMVHVPTHWHGLARWNNHVVQYNEIWSAAGFTRTVP